MTAPVLILGANSDIARALAHTYAQAGHSLYLAARKSERLHADVSDLKLRYGAEAHALEFDARAFDSHEAFYAQLAHKPEMVICVFGYLGEQEEAEGNWQMAQQILDVNYTGAVSILHVAAQHMRKEGKGTIVGISSVAGERGRGSNYYYGSAKAGFTAFLSGLRNKLSKENIHVMTVKPGFARTAMTEGLDLPGPLTAEPAQVAKDIFKAVKKKKDVVYTLWMWRWVMLIIRNIPEFLFKKLSL